MKNNLFEMLTGRSDSHLGPHGLEMSVYDDFEKIHHSMQPQVELGIVSAYRSYDRQLQIWNAKAQGQRDLYDRQGELIDYHSLTEEQLCFAILNYSAIPGASRHHWGSDFDCYDHNVKDKSNVQLTNQEYENEFSALLEQLQKQQLFYRPYLHDKGGVAKELWHLSHHHHGRLCQQQYSYEVFIKNIQSSNIVLKEVISFHSEQIYQKYINC